MSRAEDSTPIDPPVPPPPFDAGSSIEPANSASPIGPEVLDCSKDTTFFSVGTLRYTKSGLIVLFSWLMWNDLCLMLMEKVAPVLVPFIMKDNGATNSQIALYTSTLTGLFTIWINPVVSTMSDRYRSRAGRRRPFLLFATPFCAIGLAAIRSCRDVFHHFQKNAGFAHFVTVHPLFGIAAFIGLGYLFYATFNSVILAIFTYYFWDVVPEAVLGRFSAMTKIVGTIVTFIWSFFLFGLSERHTKAVFGGVAIFFFVAYVVSILNVKEGEYPPPSQEPRRSFFGVIGSYFQVCYRPYYLWFIVANTVYQVGNLSNNYLNFLYAYDLHMSRDTIGRMQGLPSLVVIGLAFSLGSVVDRFKPGRTLICGIFLYAVCNTTAFFFLHGATGLFVLTGAVALVGVIQSISQSVFTVEFFPRDKIGQFCSANAMMSGVTNMMIAPLVGRLFDLLNNYRYAYLWSSSFYLLSLPLYYKAYRNLKRVNEQPPIPLPVLQDNGGLAPA